MTWPRSARRWRTVPQPRKVIVTDAVFSVDGDLAPLAELADLATQFGALLVVDEAHSIGVLGHAGAGACSAAGVLAGDVVRTFTCRNRWARRAAPSQQPARWSSI